MSKTNILLQRPASGSFLDDMDEDSNSNLNHSGGSSYQSNQSSCKSVKKWMARKILLQDSNTDTERSDAEQEQVLAERETRHVFRLRVLVLISLVAIGIAVSAAVYNFLVQREMDEFETQYEGASAKVIETFEQIMERMGSVSSLGMSLTSYGLDHKGEMEWPFVTLSNFPEKANHARQVSGALMVSMSHHVTSDTFDAWDNYVTQPFELRWVNESIAYQEQLGVTNFTGERNSVSTPPTNGRLVDPMHYADGSGVHQETPGQETYLPIWQNSPYISPGVINTNQLRRQGLTQHVMDHGVAVMGPFVSAAPGSIGGLDRYASFYATLESIHQRKEVPYLGDPMATLFIPVFDTFDHGRRKVVGVLTAVMKWGVYFSNILPDSVFGVVVVLHYAGCSNLGQHQHRELITNIVITPIVEQQDDDNTQELEGAMEDDFVEIDSGTDMDDDGGQEEQPESGQEPDLESSTFTYVLNGNSVEPLGFGDLHDTRFDKWRQYAQLNQGVSLPDGTATGIALDSKCSYHIHVYPSKEFYAEYETVAPYTITVAMVSVFALAILLFLFYDCLVERRQKIVLRKATQSTAIVSSLFPKNVRDRLMEDENTSKKHIRAATSKGRIKGFLAGETGADLCTENDASQATIADLFPHCTVFFGDIAGFTAWSSTREPNQIFILLQTLYLQLDLLAKKRKVFKVETIGDCYMCVTGLPEPQDSHASIMVRFAYDALVKMNEVTRQLESTLGPETTGLTLRMGMHSGPVTAGVLRGDRARFQLFGDTVNTASRMESMGKRSKIQVSDATATILRSAGKEHWLTPREDAIMAKGKGIMKTFWARPRRKASSASGIDSQSCASSLDFQEKASDQAQARLVDWIVKLMIHDIDAIIADRPYSSVPQKGAKPPTYNPAEGGTCMNEVKEFIHMPKFDANKKQQPAESHAQMHIDDDVKGELTDYVTAIAAKYRNNPFHNFEHACHVTMSVTKLLKRITTPEMLNNLSEDKRALDLHGFTHGINDPLAMFAMTFSALIHDVDHKGVSNTQLGLERKDLKEKYNDKSIAEQHSLDLAWEILMQDRFAKLRTCIFATNEELLRFRQLIVNVVLATDIFDKELNDLRKRRWQQAFMGQGAAADTPESEATRSNDERDMKATIVIEHIIQASDVSHTMQHWHVYQKWNKRLFKEMYAAHKEGRFAKDPAEFWYKGEMGFFDNYIIPLARKLKECGVFGVSSDEYLDYALQNRAEWEVRGQSVVDELVQELREEEEEKNGGGEQPFPSLSEQTLKSLGEVTVDLSLSSSESPAAHIITSSAALEEEEDDDDASEHHTQQQQQQQQQQQERKLQGALLDDKHIKERKDDEDFISNLATEFEDLKKAPLSDAV